MTPGLAIPSTGAFLRLPADPSLLATVRTFVTSFVARQADDERAADLQLAVQEACAELHGDALLVRLEITDERIEVRCDGVLPPSREGTGEMRLRLLEALAPDAEWDGGGAVRFSMPRSA